MFEIAKKVNGQTLVNFNKITGFFGQDCTSQILKALNQGYELERQQELFGDKIEVAFEKGNDLVTFIFDFDNQDWTYVSSGSF